MDLTPVGDFNKQEKMETHMCDVNKIRSMAIVGLSV